MNRALTSDTARQLLADGWVLILVRGWYWLVNGKATPLLVNCNSAKSLVREGLDEWKIEAWTGDRVFANQSSSQVSPSAFRSGSESSQRLAREVLAS